MTGHYSCDNSLFLTIWFQVQQKVWLAAGNIILDTYWLSNLSSFSYGKPEQSSPSVKRDTDKEPDVKNFISKISMKLKV